MSRMNSSAVGDDATLDCLNTSEHNIPMITPSKAEKKKELKKIQIMFNTAPVLRLESSRWVDRTWYTHREKARESVNAISTSTQLSSLVYDIYMSDGNVSVTLKSTSTMASPNTPKPCCTLYTVGSLALEANPITWAMPAQPAAWEGRITNWLCK